MNALHSSLKVFFGFAARAGYAPDAPSHLIRRAITSPGPAASAAGGRRPEAPRHLRTRVVGPIRRPPCKRSGTNPRAGLESA